MGYSLPVDLRQLRHFLAVVEHGSILRASAALPLSQPALSRSIQSLENLLDQRLLVRSARGVEPTPHGLLLARHARRLLAEADRAQAELRGLDPEAAPRLAIGTGTHLTSGEPLARVVAALMQSMPNLTVRFLDGSGDELAALLQRRDIDVAVCAWPPDGTPDGLVFEELTASELLVVARHSHPLARRRRVSPMELAEAKWALAERPQALANAMHLAFAAAGTLSPIPIVRSTSLGFLRALLLESNLLAIVPAGFFAADLASGSLVALPSVLGPATTRVGVLRRRAPDCGTPAVAAFLEGLRREMRVRRGGESPR